MASRSSTPSQEHASRGPKWPRRGFGDRCRQSRRTAKLLAPNGEVKPVDGAIIGDVTFTQSSTNGSADTPLPNQKISTIYVAVDIEIGENWHFDRGDADKGRRYAAGLAVPSFAAVDGLAN